MREWSAGRVWLARPAQPLPDRLFRGDVGYRNALGLLAFLTAVLVTMRLGAADFDPPSPRGYALIAGLALLAAALLYGSIREPRAVLDLRGSDLRSGRRRLDAASLQAVVMGEQVFEDFQLIDGGQSIAEDRKSFYRLDLRTAAGPQRLLASPSERGWSAEEVRAGRSFAAALARRLNIELELDDRR